MTISEIRHYIKQKLALADAAAKRGDWMLCSLHLACALGKRYIYTQMMMVGIVKQAVAPELCKN